MAWECSLNESWMTEPFIDLLTQIIDEEYPDAKSAKKISPYNQGLIITRTIHNKNLLNPRPHQRIFNKTAIQRHARR